jgi:hypothetical protein
VTHSRYETEQYRYSLYMPVTVPSDGFLFFYQGVIIALVAQVCYVIGAGVFFLGTPAPQESMSTRFAAQVAPQFPHLRPKDGGPAPERNVTCTIEMSR